jgi:hypothetical protein
MKDDIQYKSYMFRRGQFMNAATKERRLAEAKISLNRLKAPAANNLLMFFSDEKNFSPDQKVNRKKNNNKISIHCDGAGYLQQQVGCHAPPPPPHFFTKGLKINAEE